MDRTVAMKNDPAERPTPASEPQPKTEEVSNVDEARSQSQLASVSATPSTLAPPDTDARIAALTDERDRALRTREEYRLERQGLQLENDRLSGEVMELRGQGLTLASITTIAKLEAECSRLRATLDAREAELELERRKDHGQNAWTNGYEAAMQDYAAGRTAGWPALPSRAAASLSEEPNR